MTAEMIAATQVAKHAVASALPKLLYIVPFLIVGLWIGMGALLGFQSGWFELARRFPDRSDPAVVVFKYRSGWFRAGLAFNGILILSVCRTGLRVGVVRIFGPFSKDFFVPWDKITVTRGSQWLGPAARLQFDDAGALSVRATLANELARAAGDRWPEPGPFPAPTGSDIAGGVLREWLIYTAVGSAILTAVPLMLSPHAHLQPLRAILAAAVLSGFGAGIEYLLRGGRAREIAKREAARQAATPPPEVDAPPPGS